MGLTSLQVCMDSSDWLQGTISEEAGLMDSSSPSGGGDNNILACSRPLMERRLRPQHDQALKCPRCDSTHTKFCYYNNYSLSQPRYFCKTCRRYWTKGGTLRNIPVGGGCRKNKKVSNSSKKSNPENASSDYAEINYNPSVDSSSSSHHQYNLTDLHLSFPEIQFSQLSHMFGNHQNPTTNFMEAKCNAMFENNVNPRAAIEFVEGACKYNDESHFLGSGMFTRMNGVGDHMGSTSHGLMGVGQNFQHGVTMISSPFAMTLDGINNGSFIDTTFHRGSMLPNYQGNEEDPNSMIDVKPNTKLLSLEWPQDNHQDVGGGKESFGYVTGLGSWAGLMDGYGPSSTNPLV